MMISKIMKTNNKIKVKKVSAKNILHTNFQGKVILLIIIKKK